MFIQTNVGTIWGGAGGVVVVVGLGDGGGQPWGTVAAGWVSTRF